jgi:competence protein ComGC
MKKNSQRLFMMEMVLCILILFVSLSITNMIFVRSMTQHQANEAMIKMSETMVMLSEKIQSNNANSRVNEMRINFDVNGNQVRSNDYYQLDVTITDMNSYSIYALKLFTLNGEKLLSWDVVKVVE